MAAMLLRSKISGLNSKLRYQVQGLSSQVSGPRSELSGLIHQGIFSLCAFTFFAAKTSSLARAGFFMTSLTEIAPPLGRDTASSAVESDFAVSLSIPLPSFCDKELTVWYSFIVRLKASATSDEWSQTTTG